MIAWWSIQGKQLLGDIAGLFQMAYKKVVTVNVAEQSFKATGLVSLNSQIFNDSNFEPSMTTEMPYRPRHDTPEIKNEKIKLVADENIQEVYKNEDLEPTPEPFHPET